MNGYPLQMNTKRCKVDFEQIIQDLKPALNENVGSAKPFLLTVNC